MLLFGNMKIVREYGSLVLSSNFGYGNSERRELVSGRTYVQSEMDRPSQRSKEILGR